MATNYTIYLNNQNMSDKTFWCFLDTPAPNVSSEVFANSSASLYVPSRSTNVNSFTVPLQFSMEAGASNRAVGLNVLIRSTASLQLELGDTCNAHYYDAPPKRGPDLKKESSGKEKTVNVITNHYDEEKNRQNKWYESQTFGIETADGFMGLTWSPSPGETSTITPNFAFYISTGSFTAHKLADIHTVSNGAARISLKDFSSANEVWVTLDSKGQWNVSSTKPSLLLAPLNDSLEHLTASHLHLTRAHAELVSYASDALAAPDLVDAFPDSGSGQQEKVVNVKWNLADGPDDALRSGEHTIRGVVYVATAAAFAFTTFICAGVVFTAQGGSEGVTDWSFTYNGTLALPALQEILKAGANILLQR